VGVFAQQIITMLQIKAENIDSNEMCVLCDGVLLRSYVVDLHSLPRLFSTSNDTLHTLRDTFKRSPSARLLDAMFPAVEMHNVGERHCK